MKLQNIIIVMIFPFLNGCNLSDSVKNLSGGYQIVHEGRKDNFIIGEHSIPANIISYSYNDNFILIKQMPDREAYKASLSSDLWLRYRLYHNYIDGKLHKGDDWVNNVKSDSTIFEIFSHHGISLNNTKEDLIKSQKIVDSILKRDPYYQKLFLNKVNYWIISHYDKNLYGPFTKEEYLQKYIELKVSEELKL